DQPAYEVRGTASRAAKRRSQYRPSPSIKSRKGQTAPRWAGFRSFCETVHPALTGLALNPTHIRIRWSGACAWIECLLKSAGGGKHDETQVASAFGGTLICARHRYGSGPVNNGEGPSTCQEFGLHEADH